MSMRAAAMNPMISADQAPSPVREPGYFLRKLVLLVLLVSATALWTVLLFKGQDDFPLILSTIFTDVGLGMIAGFGSRVVLHKRGLFVQSLAGIVLTVYGMILAGSLTHWVLGIGPIALQPDVVKQLDAIKFDVDLPANIRSLEIDPQNLLDLHRMNWADPLHLLGSLFMTLMSLYAWRLSVPGSQAVEVTPLSASPVSPEARPVIWKNPNSNGRPRIGLPAGLIARLRPASQPGPGSRSRNRIRPMVFREPKAASDPRSKSRRRRSRSKAHIQFALVEEHRCPYCLDAVTRNDSRGVKECEVCHTLHHADCWSITGVCQVPHLNT
jgi:ribosomal protein L37AE/L43A